MPGGVAQLVGTPSRTQKIVGSIPGQGAYLGWGFEPQLGYIWQTTDRCFSLSLMFLSLCHGCFSLSLPKINKHILG